MLPAIVTGGGIASLGLFVAWVGLRDNKRTGKANTVFALILAAILATLGVAIALYPT